MARLFALSSATLLHAGLGQDSAFASQFMTQFTTSSNNVPSSDKCGVNCQQVCAGDLSKDIKAPGMNTEGFALGIITFSSNTYCVEACVAHSIETTRSGTWGGTVPQGMYTQKVMKEYCERGLCKGSMAQQKAEVKAHDQWWGSNNDDGNVWDSVTIPAKDGGWPSGCASADHYCAALCGNMYHTWEGGFGLGYHPGADNNWEANRETCYNNCNADWKNMQKAFDGFCSCAKKNGMPSVPAKLVQESETESVDVGSFIQMPGEL